jgi:glycosyltransferase involved in cell wall biosynthesis
VTRILILLTTDRFSSPARLVVQAIENADHRRYTMTVGCTWQGAEIDQSEFFQELRRRGIPLQILPQRGSLDPKPVLEAIRFVRATGIDLVETHGYKACFIGFFLKLFTRRPWITVMHGHTAENRKMKVFSRLELILANYADRIVTVSAEMRSRLVAQGLPPGKTVTIPNAIDPVQFTVGGEPATRAGYGVAADEFLIGVVGRFSPEKGQDLFVEAFSRLAAVYPSLRAIFLGEGPTEQQLRALVREHGLEERMIFAGYHSRITDFYPLLDLVVMPSRSEGMPSVALEALFCRIPLVATAVGGTAEVITTGENGLLVPAEDPEKLAAAIECLYLDNSLRERFSAAGAELIRARFLPEARVKAFAYLYESLRTKG